MYIKNRGCILALILGGAQLVCAQTKPEPDVIVFADGEKLVGQFVRSNGGSMVFKSDMIGEITVDWSKIKEFDSSKKLAVIPKGVALHKKAADTAAVPQGTLTVAAPDLTVTPSSGPPQTVAIAKVDHV